MNLRAAVWFAIPLLLVACAKSPPPAVPVHEQAARVEARPAPPPAAIAIADFEVDKQIVDVCAIDVRDVDDAPNFDFDESILTPTDQLLLVRVARCLTTGPLASKTLELVGRADPRGETEYNFELGEHRAASVAAYLELLGVPESRLSLTSRGKLDATGTDEIGWARDRRVDLLLL